MVNDIVLGDPREDQMYPEDEQYMLGTTEGVADPMKEAMPIAPATADKMAFKFFYGLGDILKKSQSDLYGDLLNGQELDLRSAAAAEIDARKAGVTEKAIMEFAKRKGGNLSFNDISFIENSISKMTNKTDIYSVLEEGFGRKVINELERTAYKMPSNIYGKAQKEVPEQLAADMDTGSRLMAQTEYVNTKLQQIEDDIKAQTGIGWTLDQLKFLFPGFSDATLRGHVPGVSMFDGLLGSNLMEQGRALSRITDFDEYKRKVDAILDPMRKANPTLAAMFASALKGMSYSDETVQNALPLIDYTSLPYVTAGKLAVGAARKIGLVNEARTAIKTQLKEVANAPDVTPAVIDSASGNLEGAALKRISAKLIAEKNGVIADPTIEAVEALPDVLQTLSKKLEASPGRYGQEMVNRINERRNTMWADVTDAFFHMQRVERLQEVQASEAAGKAILDTVVDDHPGIRGRVLNMSVYEEPFSNTRYVKVNLGDNGAKYFASREVAENFAKDNGLVNPKIVSQEGVPLGSPKRAAPPSEIKKYAEKEASLAKLEKETIPNLEKNIAEGKLKPLHKDVKALKKEEESLRSMKAKLTEATSKAATDADAADQVTWLTDLIKGQETLVKARKSILDKNAVKYHQEQLDLAKEIASNYRSELYGSKPTEGVTGFKTAKGSTYTLNPNGTTIRNKAARPEHPGDSGIKPASTKTVYITPDQARAMAPAQGSWRIADKQGHLALFTRTVDGKDWGIPGGAKGASANIKYSTEPSVGKIPVELWGATDDVKGTAAFREVHFGNPITQLITSAGPQDGIAQQGLGYYITKYYPVRETSSDLRNIMEQETKREGSATKSPISLLNSFIGMIRTPDDTLSLAQRQNRKVVTESPKILVEIAKRNAAEIKALVGWKNIGNKQRWKDFTKVVESAMDEVDPLTGKKGYFYETPDQLDTAYLRITGDLPDEKATRAYFAFVDQMELDRMIRNISEHRNRARVGAETHQFYSIDGSGKRVGSGFFDGVARGKFPGGEGAVLVVGDTVGTEKVYSLGHIPPKLLKEFQEQVESGKYKLIEVYSPEHRFFRNFGPNVGDRRVRYVMARDMDTKDLTWDHVPRRGGGHFEYEAEHYIKQAIMREETIDVGNVKTAWYEGDRTIMAVALRSMGENVAKVLNDIKDLIREGKLAEAEALSNSKMQVSWDEVHGWFKDKRGPGGEKIPAALSLDKRARIQVVGKNESIINKSKELENEYGLNVLKDGTRSGSLNRNYQVAYTAERDAFDMLQVSDIGTKDAPLYKVGPAEKVDPISTMNRALQRIINSNFMDDYKIFSVEHWLAEANQWLKASKSDVRHSPFWHFNNPDWKPDAPKDVVRSLMTQHYQIQQLMGIPSVTDGLLHSAAQKLSDSVYTKLGPKGIPLDPAWVLPKLSDPFRFLRSIVFHTSMGLFSPLQFIVQAMNHVNILGIAGPKYAISGTYASQLHFWSGVNSHPSIIKHLDKLASDLSFPGMAKWRPGEWTEANFHLKQTGFGLTGKEYAVLDDVQKNTVIDSKFGSFLDAGAMFFRGGERNAKYTAWYTAFKEFKDANPTVTIGKAERAQILERANILNINMSRASSSMLHSGILSIPTQFYAYQIRMIELMLGNRITNVEKLRLFGTNAMMYGLPTAGGVFGFPAADNIRTYALENGYVVGDNFLSSLFMEGIPSSILALSGYNYNFGDRYGTKGLETLNNLFRSDKTMWDIFGGAAYSKLKSTWQQSDGFRMAVGSIFRTDSKWEPTVDDIADVFKEVSSFNSAFRLMAALNTGKWISKKEAYITDVTPMNAIFQAITGLSEQKVSDIYRMTQSIAAQKDLEKYVEKQFDQEFKRFLLSNKDNNRTEAQRYLTRAIAFLRVGGYPQDKISSLISRSADTHSNMIDRIDWSFYIENAPDSQRDVRLDAFKRKRRMSETQ